MLRAGAILSIALLAFVPQIASALDKAHNSKQAEQRRNKKAKTFLPVDTKSFSVRGQAFTLVERKNRRGQVIEQYLISKDRTEISRDPKGLGFLKSWELVTPGRRIYLHEPLGGHFSLMDVQQVTKNFIYDMSFFRTRAGKYRLLNIKTRKFGPQLSTMPVNVVAGCKSGDAGLPALAGQINEIVKAAKPDDLESVINKNILHESCREKPFDDRTKDILEGIRTVFQSDSDWSRARAEEVKKNQFDKSVNAQGSYLQCLRYHELDTHASRIEAALAGYIGTPDPNQQFPWKIRCSTASYYRLSKVYGEFTPSIGTHGEENSPAPTITFFDNYGPLGSDLPKRGKGDEPYAKTFFHEMLHYSLIGDGPLLNAIVNCCVPNPETGSTDSKGPFCRDLDAQVRKLELTQQVTNQFGKLFGKEEFKSFVAEVQNEYGTEKAQSILYQVFDDIGQAYSDLEQKGKCNFSRQTTITQDCVDRLKVKVKQVLDSDLSRYPEIREAILNKFGFREAAGNSYCVSNADSLMDFFHQNMDQQIKKVASWLLPGAWADPSNSKKYFCAVANEKSEGPIDYSLPISDYSSAVDININRSNESSAELGEGMGAHNMMVPSKPELDERAGQGDSSSSSSNQASNPVSNPASTGGSETKHYDQPPGPRRTHYSENPSERAIQIENLYRNEESGVTGYFNRLASKLETVTVPEAKASDSTASSKETVRESGSPASTTENSLAGSRGPVAVSESSADSGRGRRQPASENFKVRVPAFDVPDPLQSAGPLGSTPGVAGGPAAAGTAGVAMLASSPGNQGVRTVGAAGGLSGNVVSSAGVSARGGGAALMARSQSAMNPVNAGKAAAPRVGGNEKAERKPAAKENDRAAQALLAHLQKKFSLIKHELRRPSVVKSMQRHFIQAIDDKGRVYGSGFPKPGRKLIYNKEKDRLVPEAAAAQ